MSVRGNVSYPQESFGGGLNLRDKADAVVPDQAIDLIDVRFTDRGAVEQRPGYDNLTAALTNRVASLEPFYTTGGTKQLLAGCGTRLEALSNAGAVVASATGLTSAVWDFARFGKPNAEVAYAGNGTDTLRKWSGSEWTAPTATVNGEAGKAMPKAGSLCVWPEAGNRLVATRFSTTTGGPGGATSSPDHVWFSDPGNAEAWHTTEPEENDVQLFPGNGEPIMAAVAWREFVFVFKETSFFVFYNVSGETSPTFNFRPVEAGVGLASSRAVCAHHTGVYFMSRNGVYRTTGQEPELVSSLVEPIWTGDVSPFYLGGTLAQGSIAECAMSVDHEDNIRLSFPLASGTRVLVFEPRFDRWSLESIPASCFAVFRPSSAPELVFGYASGEKMVGRHSSAYTNDDGTAISSHWRSGWFDLNNPDMKVLRSSKYWGSGKCFCGMGVNFEQGTGKLAALDFSEAAGTEWDKSTWGGGEWETPSGLLPDHYRIAARGAVFSRFFSNSIKDSSWSVHRATDHLRTTEKPERAAA